jgi:hypothetical protein
MWGDNYHATWVEDGPYLWWCRCYIELNMVRCGVVMHPRDWPWAGYHEIPGHRQRYPSQPVVLATEQNTKQKQFAVPPKSISPRPRSELRNETLGA